MFRTNVFDSIPFNFETLGWHASSGACLGDTTRTGTEFDNTPLVLHRDARPSNNFMLEARFKRGLNPLTPQHLEKRRTSFTAFPDSGGRDGTRACRAFDARVGALSRRYAFLARSPNLGPGKAGLSTITMTS